MQPVAQDINIYQGDVRNFFFRVRQQVFNPLSGLYEPGDYTDLTNWTGKSQIRNLAGNQNTSLLAEWTVNIVNQTSTRGGVLLRLSPAQTAALPQSGPTIGAALAAVPTLVWDVQLTDPTGDPYTFIAGGVRVLPEVTRL